MAAILERHIPTLADMWERLGGIPLERILYEPVPGTATEEDVVRLFEREKLLCELVDGVLVEKPIGYKESAVAAFLIRMLQEFAERDGLGVVTGEAGMMHLAPNLVRIPDVSIVLWRQLPGHEIPAEPIPHLTPDLAVEVLRKSNTPAEMERKIGEYFAAGTQYVWIVDPAGRSVTIYSSPTTSTTMTGDGLVEAPSVLPGFNISAEEIFRRAGLRQPST